MNEKIKLKKKQELKRGRDYFKKKVEKLIDVGHPNCEEIILKDSIKLNSYWDKNS